MPKAHANLLQVSKPPPLDLMETGHDILYFWVFRMILMSLELCDQLPFSKVLLHGLLRDANGRKMSKSLGNAIDPMHIINGAPLETLQRQVSEPKITRGFVVNKIVCRAEEFKMHVIYPEIIPYETKIIRKFFSEYKDTIVLH